MKRTFTDCRVFWREFRANFHTTGAILPSGRQLAVALARYVPSGNGPKRVLEVGPGTGAVTAHVVAGLGPEDRLDLVELNEQFVRRLEQRFAEEPAFQQAASRVRILHQTVESLPERGCYDVVVSGLPLNNFELADVERLLGVLTRLLSAGGTLSFFEYIAIRKMRALVGNRAERQRLRGIGAALDRMLGPYEIRRECVWPNLPPAWVHHVRPGAVAAVQSGASSRPTTG